MPVRIDITDFKCYNQLRNGDDFTINRTDNTPNLVGNIGEKINVEYNLIIQQFAATETPEEWYVENDTANSFRQIERFTGSFIEDGIQVGDEFNFYTNWEDRRNATVPGDLNDGFQGRVTFISNDGSILKFDVIGSIAFASGFYPQSGDPNVGISFNQNNPANLNSAIFLKYGLIGNEETFNFLSKTTGSEQVFYRGGITPSPADPPLVVTAESLGKIKDWVSGRFRVGLSPTTADFEASLYAVDHTFILDPFYILAYREFIENNTVPELLAGESSIKYAFQSEFRKTLTNTGSSKSDIFQNLPGFVGWFGENFNGLNNGYQIVSVAYEDVLNSDPYDGINISRATKVTITVDNINGAITDYSCAAYIIRVPQSEDEYIGTETDIEANYIYKNAVVSSPATSATDIDTSLVGGDLVIEFEVSYSTAEKLRLETDDEYLLWVQVEDPTISAGDSDRVALIADFKNYVDVDFLAGFINAPEYNFISHQNSLGSGKPNTEVCNEDGIVLEATIGTDTTKDVVINGISAKLVAYNSSINNFFELDNYDFSLGDFIESNGVQQLEIETTRGYPLPAGDTFNLVRVQTLSQVGDFQQYKIVLGQKIKWQEWINNLQVDPVFFDTNQPNNNLNEKSSNYSGLNGYVIKLALVINVTGLDSLGRTVTGDVINYGGDLEVNDYEVGKPSVTGTLETFDPDSGQSLNGGVLFNGKDTLFKCTFLNADLITYAIHRIEPSQNAGDGILELSSFLPSVDNNLLKPLEGETGVKLTFNGTTLVSECLIDGSLIQEGVNYKLSARAGNTF